MLAIRQFVTVLAVGAVFVVAIQANLLGQNPVPPSQKAMPAPVSPPNVHVPTARQQMYSQPSNDSGQAVPGSSRRGEAGPSVTLTDETPQSDGSIQLASFTEGQSTDEFPQVPEILRGNKSSNSRSHLMEAAKAQAIRDAGTRDLPQITSPKKTGFGNQHIVNRSETQQGVPDSRGAVEPPKVQGASNELSITATQQAAKGSYQNSGSGDARKDDGLNARTMNMANQNAGLVVPAANTNPGGTTMQTDSAVSPAAVFLPSKNGGDSFADRSANEPGARVSLATPTIQIESFGPQTIGIQKKSQFKIVAKNLGPVDAERVVLAISFPNWVRIENVNATTGRKEVGDDQKANRIVWSVDRIASNATQTVTVDVVPSKAEMFDLQVELAQQPRTGYAHVEVTEPRLDMRISGPNEVLYGETAIYEVTVKNPGTGKAEAVNVMLPEALGGERATLGDIGPGEEKNFRVELLARTAGKLDLATTAIAAGDLQTTAAKEILVRRAALNATITGPEMKYAGTVGVYDVEIRNSGDATARDVVAALALPNGVQFIEGIDAVDVIESGLRWSIGTLDAGDSRQYRVALQLNVDGQVQMELGARGQGDIAAVGQVATFVETVADLVLSVEDPKGPLPTGQDVDFLIRIRNRGSRAARSLNLVMNFSDGIEPSSASGHQHELAPGQVIFSQFSKIEPGDELVVHVNAKAVKPGTHIFRAQLTGEDSDVREMAEGTTKFYGDETPAPNAGGGSFDGNQR